jgi:hypothetical protein
VPGRSSRDADLPEALARERVEVSLNSTATATFSLTQRVTADIEVEASGAVTRLFRNSNGMARAADAPAPK